MNIARSHHSSCAAGSKLYVLCGFDENQEIDSVEVLDTAVMGSSQQGTSYGKWNLFTIPGLTPRAQPIMLPIDESEGHVLVLGGFKSGLCLSDGLVFAGTSIAPS